MLRRFAIAVMLMATLIAITAPVGASSIDLREAALEQADDGYAVNAGFNVELTGRLEEALQNGVALYFLVEFELVRPRWYWFDERTVASRLQYRLTYHALSRQYRLWTGNLHQPFGTLAEALRVLGRVRNWIVLEREQVAADRNYQAALRMRLDTALLPKPFQVSAITNRDWTLSSDWIRFNFTPGALPAPPANPPVRGRAEEAQPR